MRRYILIVFTFTAIFWSADAQDLPLFNQKLTNSFLYNPSLAGNGKGTLSLSHRSFWTAVPGAPSSQFLSIHSPFSWNKVGAGFSILNERVGVYDNLYLSGAFSYHLHFDVEKVLSFGLSTEFTNLRINQTRVDVMDFTDQLIINSDSRSSVDFSFGATFRTQYYEIGLSSNRLATALKLADFSTQITQFYTGYIAGKLGMAQGILFEPFFTYRMLTPENAHWETGTYFTFNQALGLGASYRNGGVISPAMSLRLFDKYLIGYSFEMLGSGIQRNSGSMHEITLRMDFRDDAYMRNTRNSMKIMEDSWNFRRRNIGGGLFGGKPLSASSSKYNKKLKRNYMRNPNYRIENSDKLTDMDEAETPKSDLPKFRPRKDDGSMSDNIQKRRKANSKKYKRMGGQKKWKFNLFRLFKK